MRACDGAGPGATRKPATSQPCPAAGEDVSALIDSLTQGEPRGGGPSSQGAKTLDQLMAERRQAGGKQQAGRGGAQQPSDSGQQQEGGGLFMALGPQQPDKRTILQVGREAAGWLWLAGCSRLGALGLPSGCAAEPCRPVVAHCPGLLPSAPAAAPRLGWLPPAHLPTRRR
jgi:hypothetical protein